MKFIYLKKWVSNIFWWCQIGQIMSYLPNMVSEVRGYFYTWCLSIKLVCKRLSMGCIAHQTELLHHHLSILGSKTRVVSPHPADHGVFPFPYGTELHRSHCFQQIFFECEGIITVVMKVLLDSAPQKNSMKLGQYNAEMAGSLNHTVWGWIEANIDTMHKVWGHSYVQGQLLCVVDSILFSFGFASVCCCI